MFRTTSLAVAVVLIVGAAARADEAEDKAVAFVQKFRGTVESDEKAHGKPVVTVKLGGRVTDADLKELAPLKNLTTLNLGSTRVTDAGLKELQKALPKCKISK